MTRKEFVVQIVNDLKENPKAVLRGHGLKQNMLEQLASREDILGKIASFAFSTKLATKGKKALVKQNNMRVFAYKNYVELNSNSIGDINTFISGLSPEDQASFSNKDNIVVILALPDSEDTGNTEDNISLGKSVMLSFNTAIRKEYKIPGGMYYVIMFGDSAIRPAEAKKAEAKAVVNEKKVTVKSTSSKVKAQLISKAKAKMNKLANKNKRLNAKAGLINAELSEVGAYAKQLGLDPTVAPGSITSANRQFDRRTTAGSKALVDARVNEHKRAINTLRMKNRVLVQKMQNAATAKARADIKFAINANKRKIDQIQAKINVYSDFSARTIKNKAKILADVNAEIEANLAAGQTITNSLNAALAKLDLPAQQKQQIAQQAIEEVVNNDVSLQLATQQTLQQALPAQVAVQEVAPVQQVVAPVKRTRRRKSIEEVLNTPVEPVFSGDLVGDNFSDTLTAQKAPQFSENNEIKKVLSFI